MDFYDKLYKHFQKNDFYAEILLANDDEVILDVNGDWKHSHIFCDYLLDELGYSLYFSKVTEESDSDWYRAVRVYRKKK